MDSLATNTLTVSKGIFSTSPGDNDASSRAASAAVTRSVERIMSSMRGTSNSVKKLDLSRERHQGTSHCIYNQLTRLEPTKVPDNFHERGTFLRVSMEAALDETCYKSSAPLRYGRYGAVIENDGDNVAIT